nr:transmembrane protein 209 [Tanacetum cinerariifolium]
MKTPTGQEQYVSSPWRGSPSRKISTEKQLETFLADFYEKFSMFAGKMATPPPTINGFGSPGTNASGTTRSTPLRAVRMSPGSPMSMEVSIAAFERIGVYPQIEQWRDNLRQWFSLVLLNPLLAKIETSHLKVMEATTKLGISVTISKVGIDLTAKAIAKVTFNERNNNWQPVYTLDEEGFFFSYAPLLFKLLIQCECLDIITEHQKLLALVKGELAKGLLPQSSVQADYTVQRIRELTAGTCVKNFEYILNRDKLNNKWSELPTDSPLLLYLFCAFLEHPKWMLHVDPKSHTGVQSSKNPLFLGLLPPKEQFPEKYLAVVSEVPSVLHPGASLLAVRKQSPSVFALYWDKKPQFSFEGRTALWDSVLLLCHKIKTDYGGIVRGLHLGYSA